MKCSFGISDLGNRNVYYHKAIANLPLEIEEGASLPKTFRFHEGELEKQKRTWTLLRNGEGKWTSCRQLLISTQEILKPLLKLILTQGSTL